VPKILPAAFNKRLCDDVRKVLIPRQYGWGRPTGFDKQIYAASYDLTLFVDFSSRAQTQQKV
jgi:hypothetical protein